MLRSLLVIFLVCCALTVTGVTVTPHGSFRNFPRELEAAPFRGESVFRIAARTEDAFLDALQLFQSPEYEAVVDLWRTAYPEIDLRLHPEEHEAQLLLRDLRARRADLDIRAWIPDLAALYREVEASRPLQTPPDTTVDFFRDFQRAAVIRSKTEDLCAAHPNCEFLPSIGRTATGEDIFAVAVGGRPNGPLLYIQGGIHAREWIAPAATMWTLKELLTSTDPEILDILSKLRVVVTPLLNLDGYEYSHTTNRLWRKNRQAPPSGSSCIGIDLNRNWGEKWGGGGSSPSPCSDTYRGEAAFSAPETAAVEKLLTETLPRQGYTIVGGVDIHAYGQLILRPYGWALPREAIPPNDPELKALGERMRTAILNTHGSRYTSEHAAELYVAAGGADDWFYAVPSRGKLGFTLELRDTGRYGFLLPPEQIIPTGEEVWEAIKEVLRHVAP